MQLNDKFMYNNYSEGLNSNLRPQILYAAVKIISHETVKLSKMLQQIYSNYFGSSEPLILQQI